jgi:hypothetical protein
MQGGLARSGRRRWRGEHRPACWLASASLLCACQSGSSVTEPSSPEPAKEPSVAADDAVDGPSQAIDTPARDTQPEVLGGQSGTDAIDSTWICTYTIPFDPSLEWDGVLATELIEQALGVHAIEGRLDGVRMTGEVEIVATGVPSYSPEWPESTDPQRVCEFVEVPVDVRTTLVPVTTGAPLEMRSTSAYLFARPANAVWERAPAVNVGANYEDLGLSSPPASYVAFTRVGEDLILAGVSFSDHGGFLASPPATWHTPFPEVLETCKRAEPTEVAALANAADVDAVLSGRWALCDHEEPFSFAGVEIVDGESWRAILPGAPLRLASGFDREGRVRTIVSGDHVAAVLEPLALNHMLAGELLRMSASGNTLELGPAQLVRLTADVLPAPVPAFAPGERAGVAGCDSTETGLEPFRDQSEFLSSLTGSWVACSGFSGSMHFDGNGQLELRSTDGGPARILSYAPPDWQSGLSEDGTGQLMVGWDRATGEIFDQWLVVRSSRPAKLWLLSLQTVDGVYPEPITVSALP